MDKETKFNPEVFTKTFKANLDMFVNKMNSDVEGKALRTGNPIMDEEQTRTLARDYFTRKLAECLTDRL